MYLEILTPEKCIYTGESFGVKVPGVMGTFEILKNHAPIVAALTNGLVTFSNNNRSQISLTISGGIVEVLNNTVKIFVTE